MPRSKNKEKISGREKILMAVGSLCITAVTKFPMTYVIRALGWGDIWVDYSFEIWLGINIVINTIIIYYIGYLGKEDIAPLKEAVERTNVVRDEMESAIKEDKPKVPEEKESDPGTIGDNFENVEEPIEPV